MSNHTTGNDYNYVGQLADMRAIKRCFEKAGKDGKAFNQCILDYAATRRAPQQIDPQTTKDFYGFSFINFKLRDCVKKAGKDHDKAQKCYEGYSKETDRIVKASSNH